MRKFLWIAASIGIVLLVGAGSYFLWQRRLRTPSFERDGGTILVYEVDSEGELSSVQQAELVESIQKRLVTTKRGVAKVQMLDGRRVEIAIVRTPQHERHVATFRQTMLSTGVLEFRILANDEDDAEGIRAAMRCFDDGEYRNRQKARALRGLPPLPPAPPEGRPGFAATIGGEGEYARYQWHEANTKTAADLGLVIDDESADRKAGETAVVEARKRGEPVVLSMSHILVFTRECVNAQLPEAERSSKRMEYFVLCREPVPTLDGRPNDVGGKYLKDAYPSVDRQSAPVVGFTFSDAGADLFYDLTSRNRPTAGFHRYLAILLDGQIISAPRLNEAIRATGQISMPRATQAQIDAFCAILRAGSLPVSLKPLPVVEQVVAPTR